jgi:hypothetical protein
MIDDVIDVMIGDIGRVEAFFIVVQVRITLNVERDVMVKAGARFVVACYERSGAIKERKRAAIGASYDCLRASGRFLARGPGGLLHLQILRILCCARSLSRSSNHSRFSSQYSFRKSTAFAVLLIRFASRNHSSKSFADRMRVTSEFGTDRRSVG